LRIGRRLRGDLGLAWDDGRGVFYFGGCFGGCFGGGRGGLGGTLGGGGLHYGPDFDSGQARCLFVG